MVACALAGNISGEATTPLGNILGEAMRQAAAFPIRRLVRLPFDSGRVDQSRGPT